MPHITPSDLSAGQLQIINDKCDAFENEFLAGRAPRAEDYLGGIDEPLRGVLITELIQLELHYRSDCTVRELAERFPELRHRAFDCVPGAGDLYEFPSIPGYFIIEELGRGGMGIVYLAADLTLHRRVALKMLNQTTRSGEEYRRRFLVEARAAAQLQHPNLVRIFDSGEFDGHPFLVFEYVEGGTLASRIKNAPPDFAEAADIVEALALALQYAHDRHIIHRDLKPSNVLMGEDGIPRISDFGLAKRLDDDSDRTASGHVFGTPSYMAPEQAGGLSQAASPAVDIYSLGAILYELLTGRPPFKAATVMETLDQVRTMEPVAPGKIRPAVPRDLETICLLCLQKDTARRYQSAQLLADEIGRFRRGESIMARPVSSMERVQRWCRRHPLPASLATAVVAVSVIGFAGIWWQWREAVAQKEQAQLNAFKFQAERDRAREATERAEASAAEATSQQRLAEGYLSAAESRFEKAQKPIQELIILGTELVRQSSLEARGREALEKAAAFRQELLEEKSDDPKVLFDTARTLHVLAWTLLEHGEFDEADTTYRQAIGVFSQLHEQQPASVDYLRALRDASLQRGATLQQLLRPEEAEECCRASVNYGTRILEIGSAAPHDRIGLANALTNWSGKLVGLKRRDEAERDTQRYVEIHREVIAGHPDVAYFRESLALALSSSAGLLWSTDRDASIAATEE
ncbi:MAG: serine/threonine-protein kinase, partial [Planctomycetaceae bacterium]